MPVSTKSKYVVQLADLKRDRELIIDLWSRNLLSHTPEEHRRRFDWHYGANPYGKARCFLIHQEPGGKVIGTGGVGFRRLQLAGGSLDAGIAIDFAMEQEHRFLLPAILLARQIASLVQQDLDVIYGLPNNQAIGVFQRIGYKKIGRFQRFVKILNSDRFLDRYNLPALFRRPISATINLGLYTRNLPLRWKCAGYRLTEMAWDDERVAELCSSDQMTCTHGELSIEYLEWRYHRCPLHHHRILGLFREGSGELLGYVVVYVYDGQVKVPDFLVCSEQHIKSMFAALAQWARQQHHASVDFEVIHPSPSLTGDLKSCGYSSRGESNTLVALTKRNDLDLAPWYFLRGDEFYNTF